jgi:hypothetical protein
MNQFNGYATYQAERALSERERRMADVRRGELAADLSRLWVVLARPARALRNRKRPVLAEVVWIKHVSRAQSTPEPSNGPHFESVRASLSSLSRRADWSPERAATWQATAWSGNRFNSSGARARHRSSASGQRG